ncbi:hypothetical protein A1F97_02149 [Pyrenophora tritici-repentis]|nr:hypothetical protein A1F99_132680 [Pyrenophora tritici-repentis]KAI0585639.1 hypothetical protein Alg215_02445 [Pyrenophora tritici-repentis]KAI1552197.1 hypothetical protein PtrSN001C_000801 [Pyrenophora tritici-repentis]KAI1606830.1 hypothetical protein PtrCC142_001035 [Pyrenophora tritici-repentis]PZD33706.1 hypothetical protein A1F96_02073 [Pyrenophora tritici-repentis]
MRLFHAPPAALGLVAFAYLPSTFAKPYRYPVHQEELLGFHNSSQLIGRQEKCANPCGFEGWLCCPTGTTCYTDASNQAQCGGAATPAAGAGGYWQYHTTTYVETVGLLTKTSVFSTYVPATATQTCKDSQNPCGSTCCDSGYYCLTAGQCALIAGGSSGGIVPTGTLAPSAPLRPTSSGIVVVTYTGTPTVTVPFQTPIPTGASGSLVPTQESNNGLSGGAIAGIVIGHGGAKKGLGLAAGLGGLALALGLKRRHDAKAEDKSTTVSGTSYMYSDYTSTTQALRIATLAEHTTRQDDDRLSVVDVFLLYNFFASLRVEFPRVP